MDTSGNMPVIKIAKADLHTIRAHRRRALLLRAAEAFVTLILLVGVALVVAGFFPIRHAWLDRAALKTIRAAGVDSCSIGRIAVVPWRSLTITDLHANLSAQDSSGYVFEAGEIRISGNMVLLAMKHKSVRRTLGHFGKQFLSSIKEHQLPSLAQALRLLPEIRDIRKLSLKRSIVHIKRPDSTANTISGIGLDIGYENPDNRSFTGSFDFDNMALAGVSFAANAKGQLRIDSTRVAVSKCKGKSMGGKFRFDGALALDRRRIDEFRLLLDNVELGMFYQADSATSGKLSGQADIDLELQPGALHWDSLQGKGSITAKQLIVSNLPVQRSLVMLLPVPKLSDIQFRKIRSVFEIKPGRILTTETSGEGDILNFKAAGWMNTQGVLNQQIDGIFPKKIIGELPRIVKASLEQTSDSGRSFNCRVYGTFAEPKIELDKKIISRAVGSMFQNVKDGLKGFFR